jgi:hypothetical protein
MRLPLPLRVGLALLTDIESVHAADPSDADHLGAISERLHAELTEEEYRMGLDAWTGGGE